MDTTELAADPRRTLGGRALDDLGGKTFWTDNSEGGAEETTGDSAADSLDGIFEDWAMEESRRSRDGGGEDLRGGGGGQSG